MKRFKLLGVIIGIFAVVLIACFPMIAEDMDKSKIGVNQIPITGTYEYWTDGGFNGKSLEMFLFMTKLVRYGSTN